MYVWSKRLVISLLVVCVGVEGLFEIGLASDTVSRLPAHTIRWMALNYVLLLTWVFVWMFDQARVRGKNVWVWLVPFLIAPVITLMIYILVLQRRLR